MEQSGNKILKFVNVNDSKEEHLRCAANAASDAELDVLWIRPKEILASDNLEKDSSIFVLDPFEGEYFDYLKSKKCRLFGPQCVLSCLKTRSSLPSLTHPVFTVSMNGVHACCSSIAKHERQRLHDQIRLMGGVVMRDFTDAVTHLIAGEVGSKKYAVACSLGKPIMLPEWVFRVWEESKTKHVLATDVQFDKYKCPVFKGCTICVTGLDGPTRQEIKKLCHANGGVYSGELSMNTCTHLLVNMPRGEKYEFARKWNIHCVSTQWFYDCIKSGFWLDEVSYRTLPEDDTSLSQPGSRLNLSATANASQVSSKSRTDRLSTTAAQAAYKSAKTHGDGGLILDETKKKKVYDESSRNLQNKTINNTSVVNDMDLNFTLKTNCMFLDGCKIFLSGFSGAFLDKIRKFINVGGGTRFSMINENVSHVIIGSIITQDIEDLRKSDFHPHVVTANWIIDSAKNGKRMAEEDYIHPDFKMESDDSTPSSKENKDPSKNNNHKQAEKETNSNSSNNSGRQKLLKPEYGDGLNDDEVFLQYSSNIDPQLNNDRRMSSNKSAKEMREDEDTTHHNEEEEEQGLLSGKCFIIEHFFDEQIEHLKQLIEEHCGQVIMISDQKMADFVVLPMNADCDSSLAKQKVTFCWLEQCIQERELFDPDSNFLFQPFTIPNVTSPLNGCVMTISQYLGVERDHLMQLAELLGANCQETFVHKANRRYLASTHLLCREPGGNKYDAALKWNIPVVSQEWLFACAESGKLQPVEDFPLGAKGNTIQTKTSKESLSKEENACQRNLENLGDKGDHQDKGEHEVEYHDSEQTAQARQSIKVTKLPNMSSKQPFRPSFDLTDAMQALESPLLANSRSRKSRSSRNSFALDGFFEENIIQAVKRTGNLGGMQPSSTETHSNDKKEVIDNEKKELEIGILRGVVLAVSKKLGQQQTELYGIASSLGADYRWLYDKSCTHLIHQGKANDNSKDFTLAKEHGKYIISPHWVHACAEANSRLDENLYPHTYNPKMSLQGVTKERRLTRSSKAALENSISEDTKMNDQEINTKTDELASEGGKVSCSTDTSNNFSEESKENSKDSKEVLENSKPDSEMSDPKEDFQKQIENFISANKGTRGRRRSRRQASCSGSISTPLNSVGQSHEGDNGNRLSIRHASSRLRTRKDSQRDLDKLGDNKGRKHSDESEQSQSDTITYDDPAGRLEREKIMARLKRGCSPSPDDLMDGHEKNDGDNDQQDDATNKLENDHRGSSSSLAEQLAIVCGSDNVESESSQSIQTPVHPPVTFQLKDVEKPTPQNLLEDLEKSQDKPREVLKFQLSAMTPQEKIDFAALIEELGGQVFDTQYFKPDCSHVVVGKPNRNEKYLAAMAAGKWVLHKSFLEDSRQAGHFVNEEPHEWGTDVPGEQPNKLAKAAKRWRLKLQAKRRDASNQSMGAFNGWRVLLCVDKLRQPGFKRLLEAGGAQVLGSRPPFNNIDNVTHAFIDSNKVKPDTLDIEALYNAGIWLVKPDFIAEFLMQDPEPHPGRYLIPEAVALNSGDDWSDTSYQRKRKGDELTTDEKRARIE